MATEFEKLQTLSLIIEELHIKTIKVYHDLASHYIIQYRSLDNKILIDDIQYAKEVLSNLLQQLENAPRKIRGFGPSQLDEMIKLVSEISDYIMTSVVDMTILTLDLALESTFDKAVEGDKIRKVHLVVDSLNQLVQTYEKKEIETSSEQVDSLKVLLTSLESQILK